MEDVVFVSVAFGERYIMQQIRLIESILAIYPGANLMMWSDGTLPPGSRSMDFSLYGFKVHAIFEAKKKFTKVVWLDPAMILMDKIDDLFKYSVVAVKDDNKLYNLISDRASAYFEKPKELIESKGWHLVGGSLYYFDFEKHGSYDVFYKWYESERAGMFGSQMEASSEMINGHRNDETCMAMSIYHYGYEPVPAPDVRYCTENNPMFIKKHFK